MNTQLVKGLTLIHVMVLMALLGAILVSELQRRQGQRDTHAYYLTVAQTHMVLNNAFGHLLEHRAWPSDASGDCAVNPQDLRNGWGAEVHCVYEGTTPDASNASTFRVIQYVPPHLAARFAKEFEDDEARLETSVSAHNPPPGFLAYSVQVDRYGGADQRVDFAELSGVAGSPTTVEEIECPATSTPEAFVALGGMEAFVFDAQDIPFWPCSNPFFGPMTANVNPPDARLGYRLLFSSSPTQPQTLDISYNMYRRAFDVSFVLSVDSGNQITENTVTTNWGCTPDYTSFDTVDDYANANFQTQGETINLSVFQYCVSTSSP